MLPSLSVLLALTSLSGVAFADDMYAKSSPVLQVTAKSYDSLIAQSNYTSILEFYAPWCGHCKNLKPAYEKAAKSLAGLAKVAAINCDEDANKGLCSQMGVQGFPTLKIAKPGAKPGRPVIEDYQGARTAKAIVDAVADKIPNHVKKVQDNGFDIWLGDAPNIAKAILFTDKGTTSSLIRALAIDFLGNINIAQVRSKESAAVEKYGVTKFPTIVLLPGNEKQPITYDGEMNKASIVDFFSQIAPPNPDPAPVKAKASSSKKTKASSSATASSAFSKASKAHKSSDFEEHMAESGTIVNNDEVPTESPLPVVEHDQKPMVVEDFVPDLPQLSTVSELATACLAPKSGNCILVLLPTNDASDDTSQALNSFAELAEKHKKRKSHMFPFYSVPTGNTAAQELRTILGLKSNDQLEVIAINMKRSWWRSYSATTFDASDVENFVDSIRLGEGTKQKLPQEVSTIGNMVEETTKVPEPEGSPIPEPVTEEPLAEPAPPEPAAEPIIHNEL